MRKHIPQAVAVALLVLGHDVAAGQQTPPAAPAAQAPRPAPVRSPEIHADRRVTFRLLAPKASEVTLNGSWDNGSNLPMTKDTAGVWSTTIGPLSPQLLGYSFLVDGSKVLDPGNGEPWFAVAREARSRRDGAGVDDAMFHVAAASVHDAGWGRLVEEMVKAASQEDRMLVGTWLASADAMSYETLDLAVPDLSRYCDSRALANANRRDTCDKIATVLVDRSTTLLGRSVGVGLAKRLDWPPARLAAVDEQSDATWAVESREARRRTEPPSCGDIRSDLARLVEVGRLGEVEALRRRVARTGEPIAALADEGRRLARRAEVAGAAREAASAASTVMSADATSSAVAHGR